MPALEGHRADMTKNVVVGSSYLWRDNAKVGLHFFCEHLLRQGCRLDWFTVPLSLLHLAKPRVARIKRRYLRQSRHPRWESLGEGRIINHVPLTAVHPIPGWPILGGDWVGRNHLRLRWPSLAALARHAGIEPIDLLLFDCGGVELYRAFGRRARKTVYRISDFVHEFPNQVPARSELERQIIREADVLILVNYTMRDEVLRVRGHDRGVHVLSNGGEFERFSKPAPLPDIYRSIPEPRAVYLGSKSSWFDWELLSGTARLLPEVSFCILGHGSVPSNLPDNVHDLGSRPHDMVPGFMQHASVGLIPYRNLPRIRRVTRPLKYYEYLASGLPIVSTPHGHLKDMAPHARFGADAPSFARAIREALAAGPPDREELAAAVASYSWDRIQARFQAILVEEGVL